MKKVSAAIIGCSLICSSWSQSTKMSVAEGLDDLNYAIQTIEDVHYNAYFTTTKEAFESRKQELLSQWPKDSVPIKQFIATGMELVAMLSGGHTVMDWQHKALMPEIERFKYLPFKGKLVNGQFVVTSSEMPNVPKGTVVEKINGQSAVELFKSCMNYVGGIEGFKNAYCESMFGIFLFFNGTVSAPYKIGLAEEIITTEGLEFEQFISFINAEAAEDNYTFEVLDGNIGLIGYHSCTDYKAFEKFLAETFKTIDQKGIDKLIVDVRLNGGGNSELNGLLFSYITTKSYRQASGRYWKVSDQSKKRYSSQPVYEKVFGSEFMADYMSRESGTSFYEDWDELETPKPAKRFFEGKTCFLIGPQTFSSANFLADAIKTYQLSTLIGTSTGEYTNDFGEQIPFQLKHSGSYVFVSSTYDIGANGNAKTLSPVHPDIEAEDALQTALEWIVK